MKFILVQYCVFYYIPTEKFLMQGLASKTLYKIEIVVVTEDEVLVIAELITHVQVIDSLLFFEKNTLIH